MLYLKVMDSEPEEHKLEGCDTICPLSNFIRITEPHVLVNYTRNVMRVLMWIRVEKATWG